MEKIDKGEIREFGTEVGEEINGLTSKMTSLQLREAKR